MSLKSGQSCPQACLGYRWPMGNSSPQGKLFATMLNFVGGWVLHTLEILGFAGACFGRCAVLGDSSCTLGCDLLRRGSENAPPKALCFSLSVNGVSSVGPSLSYFFVSYTASDHMAFHCVFWALHDNICRDREERTVTWKGQTNNSDNYRNRKIESKDS